MITNEKRLIDLTVLEFRQLIRDVNKETPHTPPPSLQETSDIIGIDEVCSLTYLSKQTIYCLKWSEKIPIIQSNGKRKKLLFSRTAIIQWLGENQKEKNR